MDVGRMRMLYQMEVVLEAGSRMGFGWVDITMVMREVKEAEVNGEMRE